MGRLRPRPNTTALIVRSGRARNRQIGALFEVPFRLSARQFVLKGHWRAGHWRQILRCTSLLPVLTCQWSSSSPPCLESWEERTRILTYPRVP
jgi:hypothetical protein